MFWLLIAPKCEIWAHLPFCLTTSALLIVWIFISDPVFFFISPKISSKKTDLVWQIYGADSTKLLSPRVWSGTADSTRPLLKKCQEDLTSDRSSTRENKGRFIFFYVGLAVTQSVSEVTVCVCVWMKMSFSGHKNSSGLWNDGRTN